MNGSCYYWYLVTDHQTLAIAQPPLHILWPRIYVLSPRFLLLWLSSHHKAVVYDTSQFHIHEGDRDVKTLRPIWTSGEDLHLPLHVHISIVPYFIEDREPFIQVAFWARHSFDSHIFDLSVMDLLPNVSGEGVIVLPPISLQISVAEGQQARLMLTYATNDWINLGIVRIRTRHTDRRKPEQEGLWTYTTTQMHGRDTNGAGMVRLAADSTSQIRFGNTRQPWKSAIWLNEYEMKEVVVDGVSGRFVQFKCVPRPSMVPRSCTIKTEGVVLFAFDRAAIDSIPPSSAQAASTHDV